MTSIFHIRSAGFKAIQSTQDHKSQRSLEFDFKIQDEEEASNTSSKIQSFKIETSFRHDRMKALEEIVVRQVELSVIAADDNKLDIAMTRAGKAQEALDSLRTIHLQEQRQVAIGQTNLNPQSPMTTGVNMFELMLMVKCNMACCLRQAGRLEESLEIYTQLCRLASNPSSTSPDMLAIQTASGVGAQLQQLESKNLLFKFGLMIGNILFDMEDYQRALKYYRLTLDRLSSVGHRNFRIKLMNNISIALLKASNKTLDKSCESLNISGDFVNSLTLLQSDNISQTAKTKSAITNNEKILNVCNANHHRFGLNLLVAQYERKDIRAMLSTFKSLVGTSISEHYCCTSHDVSAESEVDKFVDSKDFAKFIRAFKLGQGTTKQSTRGQDTLSGCDVDLAKMISSKENEVKRAIVSACNLICELGADSTHSQSSDGLSLSAFHHCGKLLESSAIYKSLAFDLKMNKIIRTMVRHKNIDKSLRQLQRLEEDIEKHKRQQIEAKKQKSAKINIDFGIISTNNRVDQSLTPSISDRLFQKSPNIESNLSLVKIFHNISAASSGKETDCSQAIRQALRGDLTNSDNWVNMGYSYAIIGQHEEAIICLMQALELDPKHWTANYNRILVGRLADQQTDWLEMWQNLTGEKDLKSIEARRTTLASDNNLNLERAQILLVMQDSRIEKFIPPLKDFMSGGQNR